jgi:hypothetical protein
MDITSGISSFLFTIMQLYFAHLPHHIRLRLYLLSINSSLYHIVEYNNMNNLKQYTQLLDGVGIILVCNTFLLPPHYINITVLDMFAVLIHIFLKLRLNEECIKKMIYVAVFIKMGYECPISAIPFLCGFCGYLHSVHTKSWNHYNRTIWHIGNALFIGFSSNCLHSPECETKYIL